MLTVNLLVDDSPKPTTDIRVFLKREERKGEEGIFDTTLFLNNGSPWLKNDELNETKLHWIEKIWKCKLKSTYLNWEQLNKIEIPTDQALDPGKP